MEPGLSSPSLHTATHTEPPFVGCVKPAFLFSGGAKIIPNEPPVSQGSQSDRVDMEAFVLHEEILRVSCFVRSGLGLGLHHSF